MPISAIIRVNCIDGDAEFWPIGKKLWDGEQGETRWAIVSGPEWHLLRSNAQRAIKGLKISGVTKIDKDTVFWWGDVNAGYGREITGTAAGLVKAGTLEPSRA